jgi:uncharacterized protein (DUF433 family)
MAQTEKTLDWSGCPIIQCEQGKLGGAFNIRGERITPGTILMHYEDGMSFSEIQKQFPSISIQDMRTIVDYAQKHGLSIDQVA